MSDTPDDLQCLYISSLDNSTNCKNFLFEYPTTTGYPN